MPRSEKIGLAFCVSVLGSGYVLWLIQDAESALSFAVFWMICGSLLLFIPVDPDINIHVDDASDLLFFVAYGPILWVVTFIVYAARYLDTGSFKFKVMP